MTTPTVLARDTGRGSATILAVAGLAGWPGPAGSGGVPPAAAAAARPSPRRGPGHPMHTTTTAVTR